VHPDIQVIVVLIKVLFVQAFQNLFEVIPHQVLVDSTTWFLGYRIVPGGALSNEGDSPAT
jgi:hypothetical protein